VRHKSGRMGLSSRPERELCSVDVPPAVTGASRSREGAGRMPTEQRAGRPRYIRSARYVGGISAPTFMSHALRECVSCPSAIFYSIFTKEPLPLTIALHLGYELIARRAAGPRFSTGLGLTPSRNPGQLGVQPLPPTLSWPSSGHLTACSEAWCLHRELVGAEPEGYDQKRRTATAGSIGQISFQ
jgi:hypothetical protein